MSLEQETTYRGIVEGRFGKFVIIASGANGIIASPETGDPAGVSQRVLKINPESSTNEFLDKILSKANEYLVANGSIPIDLETGKWTEINLTQLHALYMSDAYRNNPYSHLVGGRVRSQPPRLRGLVEAFHPLFLAERIHEIHENDPQTGQRLLNALVAPVSETQVYRVENGDLIIVNQFNRFDSDLSHLLMAESLNPQSRLNLLDSLRPVAELLDMAIANEVFHRDLKPEQLLVLHTDEGIRIALGDYGAARFGRDKTISGRMGYTIGTLITMSRLQSGGEINQFSEKISFLNTLMLILFMKPIENINWDQISADNQLRHLMRFMPRIMHYDGFYLDQIHLKRLSELLQLTYPEIFSGKQNRNRSLLVNFIRTKTENLHRNKSAITCQEILQYFINHLSTT